MVAGGVVGTHRKVSSKFQPRFENSLCSNGSRDHLRSEILEFSIVWGQVLSTLKLETDGLLLYFIM